MATDSPIDRKSLAERKAATVSEIVKRVRSLERGVTPQREAMLQKYAGSCEVQVLRLMRRMEKIMAKKLKDVQELKIERPKRAKLSEEETLKRMEAFGERKEQFVASVRKGKS